MKKIILTLITIILFSCNKNGDDEVIFNKSNLTVEKEIITFEDKKLNIPDDAKLFRSKLNYNFPTEPTSDEGLLNGVFLWLNRYHSDGDYLF